MFSAYTSCISSLLTPHDPTINTSRVIREQRNVVHHTGGKKKHEGLVFEVIALELKREWFSCKLQ